MYTHPKSEFDDELVYSTSSQAREFHYTHCLGFSKSSTSPHTNRGPQKFLGKVGDFHNAIKLVVDQIAIKYESRIDLEETVSGGFTMIPDLVTDNGQKIANSPPSFKDEDIEACLKVWGPFIWTNGRNGTPFVTSIDTEDGNYPAHLKYENKNDRNRLVMYDPGTSSADILFTELECWSIAGLSIAHIRGWRERLPRQQPTQMSRRKLVASTELLNDHVRFPIFALSS